MSHPAIPDGYRIVQLIQREPPAEVLRHARMIPGATGRYGKALVYQHDATRTAYEVLHFKAGRPPSREEILADLRADLAGLDAQREELRKSGALGGAVDRALFGGTSPATLEGKLRDILETIAVVEAEYKPGEAVPIP